MYTEEDTPPPAENSDDEDYRPKYTYTPKRKARVIESHSSDDEMNDSDVELEVKEEDSNDHFGRYNAVASSSTSSSRVSSNTPSPLDWTKKELLKLKSIVAEYKKSKSKSNMNWDEVAEELNTGKTADECEKRSNHPFDKTINKEFIIKERTRLSSRRKSIIEEIVSAVEAESEEEEEEEEESAPSSEVSASPALFDNSYDSDNSQRSTTSSSSLSSISSSIVSRDRSLSPLLIPKVEAPESTRKRRWSDRSSTSPELICPPTAVTKRLKVLSTTTSTPSAVKTTTTTTNSTKNANVSSTNRVEPSGVTVAKVPVVEAKIIEAPVTTPATSTTPDKVDKEEKYEWNEDKVRELNALLFLISKAPQFGKTPVSWTAITSTLNETVEGGVKIEVEAVIDRGAGLMNILKALNSVTSAVYDYINPK